MSQAIQCDQCKKSVALGTAEAEDLVKVGWASSGLFDACSLACAKGLLDGEMAELEAAVAKAVAEDAAS